MELRNYLLPGLISVMLLSGCSLFDREEDAVKMAPLPVVENQFTPEKVWHVSVGDGIGDFYSNLHPAWHNGTVFAADRHGIVIAVDDKMGAEKWKINLAKKPHLFSDNPSALLSGGVTAADDNIYIGSERAQVYALSSKDGSVIWQTRVAGEALSQPVVSDGLVLIHTSNGMLQGLDQTTGAVKWSVNFDTPMLSLRGESAPVTAHGAAIIGGDNGQVSAVMLNQGELVWQQRISKARGVTEINRLSDVDMTPVVVNDVVYAMAYQGDLAALDLRTGEIIWKRELGSVNDLIVDGEHLYLVDQDDRVMALRADNGTEIWQQNALLHRNLTAPALYKGYIVVGDSEGYLHWLKPEDGRFIVQQKVDSSGLLTHPVVTPENLLIQAKNGKVYAYKQ